MIRVGITGGIGSGKTTAAGLFAALGVPVYNSDGRARELMESDELHPAIEALLGREAYGGDGRLDRGFIARKVFTDKGLLASLERIVHPAVAADFEAWAASHIQPAYILLESAILFESGFNRFMDRTITVSAPEHVRIERALARFGSGDTAATGNASATGNGSKISREQLLERMANQLTDSEREARADYIIDNGGSAKELADRVAQIDKILKQA
jgi:dephospho-CoA kinase